MRRFFKIKDIKPPRDLKKIGDVGDE